jgi:hypothetical protein
MRRKDVCGEWGRMWKAAVLQDLKVTFLTFGANDQENHE